MALDQVRRELTRLGRLTGSMIQRSLDTVLHGSAEEIEELSRADDDVDALYEGIISYLGQLSQKNLINPHPQYLHDFVGIANYLENIGDIIEKDLLSVAGKRLRKDLVVSEDTAKELEALAAEVCRWYEQALKALETGDPDDALDVIESKKSVSTLAEEATDFIGKRLVADAPNRIGNFQIETEIIEIYKRLNTVSRRIARLAVAGHQDGDEATAAPPAAPDQPTTT